LHRTLSGAGLMQCACSAPREQAPTMENPMTKTLIALLLLSLGLTGCIVDPNRGYGNNGWGDRGHAEYHEGGGWNH
jgi:hypothetical protein